MRLALPYGRGTLHVEIPQRCTVETLEPPSRPALDDPAGALVSALNEPVAGPPLRALLRPGMRVAVVAADWTRASVYPELLPPLLDELNRCGIGDDAVSLLVAYGTHTRQPDATSEALYGPDTCRRVPLVHHDADAPDLVEVGTTPAGTRVALNPHYLAADAAITVGAVSFHYFAGFGGGPKLVFPGLAGREGALANHALYVRQMLDEPRCLKGELDGNACAQDIHDAVTLAPPAFSTHCLLNADGALAGVIAGRWDASHAAACERLRRTAMLDTPRRYDLIVASCGGFPRDINLIQAHKSLDNACELLRDGGTVLLAAECAEGVGSDTFLQWFDLDDEAFARELAHRYELHGGTAFAMRRKTARCRIAIKSALPDEVVRRIGAAPAPDLQAALDDALAARPGARVAVLPNAAVTVLRSVSSD
jgi:nickel-dependent lactate racemase